MFFVEQARRLGFRESRFVVTRTGAAYAASSEKQTPRAEPLVRVKKSHRKKTRDGSVLEDAQRLLAALRILEVKNHVYMNHQDAVVNRLIPLPDYLV